LPAVSSLDVDASAAFVDPSTRPDPAPMESTGGRGEHDAKRRRAVFNQSDVDGIIVTAPHEIPGAVERVDQKIGVPVLRDSACRDFFLRYHRHAWRRSCQCRENDQLCRAVGFRNGGWIALW